MTRPKLSIVAASPPTRDVRIRKLLAELDHYEAGAAKAKAALAEEGRAWVRDKGEFMAPSVERLRREVGIG